MLLNYVDHSTAVGTDGLRTISGVDRYTRSATECYPRLFLVRGASEAVAYSAGWLSCLSLTLASILVFHRVSSTMFGDKSCSCTPRLDKSWTYRAMGQLSGLAHAQSFLRATVPSRSVYVSRDLSLQCSRGTIPTILQLISLLTFLLRRPHSIPFSGLPQRQSWALRLTAETLLSPSHMHMQLDGRLLVCDLYAALLEKTVRCLDTYSIHLRQSARQRVVF